MMKGKILGIDFGLVRTGIAITDEMQIIASPLEAVPTKDLQTYLKKMIPEKKIVAIVIGEAKRLNGESSPITESQLKFAAQVERLFPHIPIHRVNEMFTSKMATQSLVVSGMKKSERQKKENIDMVSAAIILQSFLDSPR
jgi:putative Holliday junction resolvase